MHKWLFAFFLPFIIMAAPDDEAYIERIEKHRAEIDAEFRNPETSPLPDRRAIRRFKGLEYYDIDPDYRVMAQFEKISGEEPFKMQTTGDSAVNYIRFGRLKFILDEDTLTLYTYQNQTLIKKEEYKNYLFLPFTDRTNGDETYGGGRYLDFSIPEGNEVELDFNLAYNPYCAYNHKYSCPIPPAENDLQVKIKAGVKNYDY